MLNELYPRGLNNNPVSVENSDMRSDCGFVSNGVPSSNAEENVTQHVLRNILAHKKELFMDSIPANVADNMNNNNVDIHRSMTDSISQEIEGKCDSRSREIFQDEDQVRNYSNNNDNNKDINSTQGSTFSNDSESPTNSIQSDLSDREKFSHQDGPIDMNKRARVEKLISSMRSSPLLPPLVNGCKKRKLYHPQQHDSDKYSSAYNNHENFDENLEYDEGVRGGDENFVGKSFENGENFPVKFEGGKFENRNSTASPPKMGVNFAGDKNDGIKLENQLKTMQDELHKWQKKYNQLRTKLEDENLDEKPHKNFDVEKIIVKEEISTSQKNTPPPLSPTSVDTNKHFNTTSPTSETQNLNPVISKILSTKIPPQHAPLHPGALSFLQHQHHMQHHGFHHHNVNNAAAMYHRLMLEQEQHQRQQFIHHHQIRHQTQRGHHSSQHQENENIHTSSGLAPRNINSTSGIKRPAASGIEPTDIQHVVKIKRQDLDGLGEEIKTEITTAISKLVDTIVARFHQQCQMATKSTDTVLAAEQLNKELLLASQFLERQSSPPRVKIEKEIGTPKNNTPQPLEKLQISPPEEDTTSNFTQHYRGPNYKMGYPVLLPEQNEALSLVVAPKKKRHKVTDSRISKPRTTGVTRIVRGPQNMNMSSPNKYPITDPLSPPDIIRRYPLPSSLPTSVAIPNPSLHESQIYSPYNQMYHHRSITSSLSPPMSDIRESPPPQPAMSALFHPALLAAAAHHTREQQMRASPTDYFDLPNGDHNNMMMEVNCNSPEGNTFDGNNYYDGGLSKLNNSHLRKAKLMFFWVRSPSSPILKTYFPDVKFNKENTAQLVKWFSNFREFYYIQIEKYARQALNEGIRDAEELHISSDSEIIRVLNLHYNKNNDIEIPDKFRFVVEETLKEFFKAIQAGKDNEQSWKKSIYKIINRLDCNVPEFFKNPNFFEPTID